MRRALILFPEGVAYICKYKANIRTVVREAPVEYLRHEPTKTRRSRIKRLRGLSHPQYRLRVDDVRVFYDVTEETVEILAIVPKDEAEAWLEKAGEPHEDRSPE